MCGILGWIGSHRPEDAARFGDALDRMVHRGPDDRGVHASAGAMLGHRRLSIIDLSPTGHQPMVDADSGATLVFNGEIYNHVELRNELTNLGHRFVGCSDTEVLLRALLEWGTGALSRLNGMWAFALWQPTEKNLLMARDRFGVKPLYYRTGPEGHAFASEPKALLELFPAHRAVNRTALADFLVNNALYRGGTSFYEGIHSLPAAHFAIFNARSGKLRIERFWEYPTADRVIRSEDAIEEFADLFDDAVRLRLRSDVPVGITLSGGLDSTAVLAAASRHVTRPVSCFTSVYSAEQSGELEWAQRAVRSTASPLIAVPAPRDDWLGVMREVSWHMDGPGYSPAVYPLWCLMKQARESGVPVLLEGQGADEALAGYPQYAVLDFLACLRGSYAGQRSFQSLWRRFTAMRATFSLRWSAAWLLRESFPALIALHRQRTGFESLLRSGVKLPAATIETAKAAGDPVRTRLLADHSQAILPGLLHYGDAISMAHSVEARHPFMDFRLVEWMFRLPTPLKLADGETKWVLREYLRARDQAVIGNRRDKKGYPTPVGAWLASPGGREVDAILLRDNSLLHEWCDPKKVRRLIDNNRRGVIGAEHHLYKLLSTQMWLQTCIEGGGLKS